MGSEMCIRDRIEEAASIAQATEFIDSKSAKYDSPIAQGGTNVSGGQKQRLSIARAIAKDPKIYIFDDSFSALDLKTEADLYSELSAKKYDVTRIIIAQRIASVKNADRIVVMDNGRLADVGSHSELIKTSEIYKDIYESQLKGNE